MRRSPFAETVPAVVAAVVFGLVALVWVAAGSALPGGRWLAVHLFTLGVLTNVVLGFTDHFGRTLTHSPVAPARWHLPVVEVGIVLVLVGLPTATRWATAAGGVLVTAVVTSSWLRLRRIRHDALGARFAWVVRAYERAHAAFVFGAVLGVLLGTGLLAGSWYGAGRLAHLHVNVLGWGGLTLLATIVFFGPTITRTRIVPGADERAARAVPIGATALTIAVLLLLGSGIGPPAATPLRVLASGALAVVATVVTIVCRPVAVAARNARPTAVRWSTLAVTVWFPIVVWADVLVVASSAWRFVDAIGLGIVLGVLVQAILATLAYLAPLTRPRDGGDRTRVLDRLAAAASWRAAAYNLGVVAVVAASVLRDDLGGVLTRTGWTLIAVSLLWLLAAAAPLPSARPRRR